MRIFCFSSFARSAEEVPHLNEKQNVLFWRRVFQG